MMPAIFHRSTWLLALASAVVIADVFSHPRFAGVVLLVLMLAHWAIKFRCALTSQSIAALVIVLLLPGTLSYITPEAWVNTVQWQRLSPPLITDTSVDNWRAPLLTTLCMQLLALSLVLRSQVHIGAPLLLTATLCLLAMQLIDILFPLINTPLLHYTSGLPTLASIGLLLAWQYVQAKPDWQRKRHLSYALWPAALLVVVTLLLWQQQHRQAEKSLHAMSAEEGQRLAIQLTQEIVAQRQAMRRFAHFWTLLDSPPNDVQWTQQASVYHADFRYFLNIAFIDTTSRIQHVYPPTSLNLAAQGQRLYQVQPSGRGALEPALEGARTASTEVIELLQGVPGIVTYWPVRQANGRLVGAAAMAISIPMLADTLFAELDPAHGQVRWHENSHVLASFGDLTHPGPWQHRYALSLAESPLTLTFQPRRDYLLTHLPRLPSIGLGIGLILAYLLYLVVYTFRQLGEQNRNVRFNNHTLQSEIEKRGRLQREIEWLAHHDDLTGIANRRHVLEQIHSQQDRRPFSLIMCDIDNFKHVNDQLGHLVGDDYLIATARLGVDVVGERGIFARYGGEEFISLLPGVDHDQAKTIAEQLRQRLQATKLLHADGKPLTLSAGVITLQAGELVLPRLVQLADEALYRAKENGRNRVESAYYPP
ncbi:diguanylate cyclase domain-containing protein [Halomonas sp. LS-001]